MLLQNIYFCNNYSLHNSGMKREFNGIVNIIKCLGYGSRNLLNPGQFYFIMNHNWYATITAQVLMAKDISSTQKLLLALISNLQNQRKYCYASNAYLGECLAISPVSISQNISELEKKGYLGRIIIYKPGSKEIEQRFLTVIEKIESGLPSIDLDIPLPLKNYIPPLENHNTPPPKNLKGNNKVFNNKVNNKYNNTLFSKTDNNSQEGEPVSIKNPALKKSNSPGAEISLPFGDEFKKVWNVWMRYRRERKLPAYAPTGLNKAFSQLINISSSKEEIAIKMLERAMENNWQGFNFKLPENNTNGQGLINAGNTENRNGTSGARFDALRRITGEAGADNSLTG